MGRANRDRPAVYHCIAGWANHWGDETCPVERRAALEAAPYRCPGSRLLHRGEIRTVRLSIRDGDGGPEVAGAWLQDLAGRLAADCLGARIEHRTAYGGSSDEAPEAGGRVLADGRRRPVLRVRGCPGYRDLVMATARGMGAVVEVAPLRR